MYNPGLEKRLKQILDYAFKYYWTATVICNKLIFFQLKRGEHIP